MARFYKLRNFTHCISYCVVCNASNLTLILNDLTELFIFCLIRVIKTQCHTKELYTYKL